MPSCSVCRHSNVSDIDSAILRRESLRDIARQFGLSKDAVARHKADHLPKKLLKAHEAKEVLRSGTPCYCRDPGEPLQRLKPQCLAGCQAAVRSSTVSSRESLRAQPSGGGPQPERSRPPLRQGRRSCARRIASSKSAPHRQLVTRITRYAKSGQQSGLPLLQTEEVCSRGRYVSARH